MIIKYNKIITTDQYTKLGDEKYYKLKKTALCERNSFSNYDNWKGYPLTNKANDISYKSSRYKDLSIVEKEILAANIIYPNSDEFAIYLTKIYPYDELKNISTILKKYKQLNTLFKKINYENNFDLELINPLIERANKVYGYNEFHNYINKINGLLVFEPEILAKEKTKSIR